MSAGDSYNNYIYRVIIKCNDCYKECPILHLFVSKLDIHAATSVITNIGMQLMVNLDQRPDVTFEKKNFADYPKIEW